MGQGDRFQRNRGIDAKFTIPSIMDYTNNYTDMKKTQEEITWEAFVKDTRPLFFGIIFNVLKNQEEAEDILQDSYIKIFQNRDKYDNLRKVGSHVCFNSAINAYRHKALVNAYLNEKGGYEDLRSRQIVPGDDYEAVQYLEELIKIFPDEEPTRCLKLFMEGYTYREISEKLSIPIGTVKSQISLTRNKIKDHIKKTNWK